VTNIVIFGATSAIAEAAARQWVSKGCSLYLVGRNAQKLEAIRDDLRVRASAGQRIEMAIADLTDIGRHPIILEEARRALGEIDVALIAHGTLPVQRECELSVERTLAEITTNALSAISLLTLLANYFESRGRGTVAAISSVAGDRGRRSNYVYGAAKGLLTRFLEGLRHRLAAKGVAVITIKPGFVDTPMTRDFDKRGFLWAKPERVARDIVRAVTKARPVVYTPWFWRYIMLVIRHIPERVFLRLDL
jgi:short-subunit dehydrogenase